MNLLPCSFTAVLYEEDGPVRGRVTDAVTLCVSEIEKMFAEDDSEPAYETLTVRVVRPTTGRLRLAVTAEMLGYQPEGSKE